MKSSFAAQTISADFRMSILERVLWLFRNFNNAACSSLTTVNRSSFSYVTSDFLSGSVSEKLREKLVSPSRALSSLSLFNLFYTSFIDTIKSGQSSFFILDFGCGNSNMLSIIEDALFMIDESLRINLTVHYHGYDPYLPDSSFISSLSNIVITRSSVNKYSNTNRFDLAVSFSVLEHIYEDISVLHDLYLLARKQVHYVPATCSLFAYLWHGYRVYDRLNLFKLVRELSSETLISVSPIGNLLSSIIYIFYTSMPDGFFIFIKLLTGRRFHKDICRQYFRSSYQALFDRSVKSCASFTFPAFLEISISNNQRHE